MSRASNVFRAEWRKRVLFDGRLSPTDRYMGAILAENMDTKNSLARVSHAKLAEQSGKSERVVRRALTALRERGYLAWKKPGFQKVCWFEFHLPNPATDDRIEDPANVATDDRIAAAANPDTHDRVERVDNPDVYDRSMWSCTTAQSGRVRPPITDSCHGICSRTPATSGPVAAPSGSSDSSFDESSQGASLSSAPATYPPSGSQPADLSFDEKKEEEEQRRKDMQCEHDTPR